MVSPPRSTLFVVFTLVADAQSEIRPSQRPTELHLGLSLARFGTERREVGPFPDRGAQSVRGMRVQARSSDPRSSSGSLAGSRRTARRRPTAAVRSARAPRRAAADRAASIRARFTSMAAMSPSAYRRSVTFSRSRLTVSPSSAIRRRSPAATPSRNARTPPRRRLAGVPPRRPPVAVDERLRRPQCARDAVRPSRTAANRPISRSVDARTDADRGPALASMRGLSRNRGRDIEQSASASPTRARATTTAPACSRARAMVLLKGQIPSGAGTGVGAARHTATAAKSTRRDMRTPSAKTNATACGRE